jgi:hypothetical protein
MTDTRGRQTRQEEVRTERRRRNDASLDGRQALKLAIPKAVEEQLTAQGRTPRWVNDVGSRMHDLTVNDDWDKVEGVEPRDVVIDRKTGTTTKAYLLSKRSDFIAEDRKVKDANRRHQEDGMLKGVIPGATPAPNTYADKSNNFGRGNQIIE